MPTMEVDVQDTWMGGTSPGLNFWHWPLNWEYISLTVIPISSNGDVEVTRVHVTSDPGSHRDLHYEFKNDTNEPLDCFATLTLPHDSVA
jgi:hypothetical protein